MEPEISYIIYGIPLVMLVVYQTILVHKFSISFPRMENKLPLKEVYSHASNYFGSTYYFILTPICVVLTITIVFSIYHLDFNLEMYIFYSVIMLFVLFHISMLYFKISSNFK